MATLTARIIELDCAYDGTADDFLEQLEHLPEGITFRIAKATGPGGNWPLLAFYVTTREQALDLLDWYTRGSTDIEDDLYEIFMKDFR